MTRTGWCWMAAMLALALVTGNSRGAAPPVSLGWVAGERRRVGEIDARASQAVLKGDFALALRLSREVLAGRRALWGQGHWQTIDAGVVVERWERLATLPAAKQRQVGMG